MRAARSLAPFRILSTSDVHGNILGYFAGSLPWHNAYLFCLGAMAATGALLTTAGPKRGLLAVGSAVATAAGLTGWLQLL